MADKLRIDDIRAKFPMYKDVDDAQLLAAVRKRFYPDIPMRDFSAMTDIADRQRARDRELYDPTKGQSFGENMLQGIGSGMTSVLRAVGGGKLAGMMGLPETKEEAEQLDAPLMDTAGGKVGRVVGQAAPAALAIPFTPATLTGAVVAGGLTGAGMTEGDALDRLQGGALGAAGGAVGHALPHVYRAGKGLIKGVLEPLTAAGRDRIAGRAIERFATKPDALAQLTGAGAPTATGARLTVAEATRDPGLATLQRAVSTMDPDAAAAFAAREQANNAARVSALEGVAGGAQQRAAAESVRDVVANPLYGLADEAVVQLDHGFDGLMRRPAFAKAVEAAQALARNEGLDDIFFRGPNGQPVALLGKGAHFIKKALDDAGEFGGSAYVGKANAASAGKTQGTFLGWLDAQVPEYAAARAAFADASRPLNQMDVGQRLLDTTRGALRDFGGNRPLQARSFARALNNEDDLVRKATGLRLGGLDDLMEPAQMGTLRAVRDELETLANVNAAANGPGSQTAKMLASQNLLRQVAGPLGLPEGFVSNAVTDTMLRPLAWGAQAAERRVGSRLGEAMLDPETALLLLQGARRADAVRPPSQLQKLLRRALPSQIGAQSARVSSE